MNENTLVRYCGTREQLHLAAKHGYAQATPLVELGKRVKVVFEEAEDELSVNQRGFLHKAVFPQISEQIIFPDGQRFEWRVWKESFRARFLGDRWVMRAIPRWSVELGRWVVPKRKTPHRERVSTEDLGLKAYSNYIDLVIDTAVTEYGVQFRFIQSERDGARYVAPRKVKPAPAPPALPLVERANEAETC